MHSLRALMMVDILPYPIMGGKDIRNWQNINGLMNFSHVGVFGLRSNGLGGSEAPLSNLIFWRSSADETSKRGLTSRAWLIDPTGHPSDMYYLETAAAELDRLMTDFNPSFVVVEGLWLHRYIDVLKRRGGRVVLDNYNIEAAVVQEIANSTFGDDLPARLIRDILPYRTKIIEQRATDTVDQVWVCSGEDARLMMKMYGSSTPIHVVPNTVNIDYYVGVGLNKYPRPNDVAPTRNTIIFPGSFRWQPNVNAATFLSERLFPRLSEIYPDCQLLLVGKDPTLQMMEKAKRNPRIVLTGQVHDVRPYLAASSIMVVPLFQGGGTRFKILEAFASNIPVISTPKGAEGLDVEDGVHLLIAESTEEFVIAVQRLWTDERIAKRLAANGLDLVKRLYSWESSSLRISEAINSLNLGE